MNQFLSNVSVPVNETTFLKDPQSSELGRKIVFAGVEMIDEIGFEKFTFRKLAERIDSTEASVYRYFESKHKFLLYIISWYWGWLEIQLLFVTANLDDPREKLMRSLELLTGENGVDFSSDYLSQSCLNRIVVSESSKAYLTREVDQENQEGAFLVYKRLVQRVSDFIVEINPNYKYPHMLVSTAIEGAHHQRFFAEHLPRLTDHVKGEDSISEFFKGLVLKAVNGDA